jgi:hypothetical protein
MSGAPSRRSPTHRRQHRMPAGKMTAADGGAGAPHDLQANQGSLGRSKAPRCEARRLSWCQDHPQDSATPLKRALQRRDLAPVIKELQSAGRRSLRAIADGLNDRGISDITRRPLAADAGHASSVSAVGGDAVAAPLLFMWCSRRKVLGQAPDLPTLDLCLADTLATGWRDRPFVCMPALGHHASDNASFPTQRYVDTVGQ